MKAALVLLFVLAVGIFLLLLLIYKIGIFPTIFLYLSFSVFVYSEIRKQETKFLINR